MILTILNELAFTTKRTEKEAILKTNIENETLKNVFRLAYTPQIQFNMKKFPSYEINRDDEYVTLESALDKIEDVLVEQKLRGHSAQDFIGGVLSKLSDDDAEVLKRVILRDLRVGCTSSTANKVWKKLVPEQPQMLASAYKEKLIDVILQKESYAELKADGARCFVYVDSENNVSFTSRNGKPYLNLVKLESVVKSLLIQGFVLDGELVYAPDGIDNVSDRSTGNGVVNKSSKGTITVDEQASIVFQVWDLIPADVYFGISDDMNMVYHKRKQILSNIIKMSLEAVGVIETIPWKSVTTKEQASEIYKSYIVLGLEGIILKDPDALWENKRSKSLVKYKEVHESDLRIVAVVEGNGKNKGRAGAIIVEAGCGKLICNVGSGFSDKQRDWFWANRDDVVGMIVEVKYNAITKSKSKDLYSLFLPIFVCIREDKEYPYILEEMDGYRG